MSLHTPLFFVQNMKVFHNVNGSIAFLANSDKLSEETLRLIELAIEYGKHVRSAEIAKLLNL